MKKLLGKKENEILQTLVIIAVIGALAITICIMISNKVKETAKTGLNDVGNGLSTAVLQAVDGRETTYTGY